MYQHRPVVLGVKISAAAGAPAGLAFTGLSLAHYLVAAGTMVLLGVVLMHLVPKHES